MRMRPVSCQPVRGYSRSSVTEGSQALGSAVVECQLGPLDFAPSGMLKCLTAAILSCLFPLKPPRKTLQSPLQDETFHGHPLNFVCHKGGVVPLCSALEELLTPLALKDIFHQLLHRETIFAPFQYIRPVPAETPLHLTDKNDIRCNRGGASGQSTDTLTVTAGDTVGFKPTFWTHHPGPFAAYLSAVPSGKTVKNYAGDGDWFKIWEFGTYPNLTPESTYQETWRLLPDPLTFPIPAATPPGQYLLRFEHVALHNAYVRGGAEFYPSCAHIEVLNAGWKSGGPKPGPTARFPEAHQAEENGKLRFNFQDFNDVQQFNSKKMPGPAVWDGR
ncbi:glycosyl hydrolase family 61-domain-containing protein [Triangularia setosa]|uniref:lytic cellulose monooxygenase (C4-dehydrogenating) n=1 Tax=Triangularia setosa TaxID=2587417 RepID=A0AAN6WEJ6_9PEZI|nr:glycosyl hydrolase family 61-domain-containing protein [Podospora setosa]